MDNHSAAKLEEVAPQSFRLELEIDTASLDSQVARRLGELRPRLAAPGFRRGKAPLAVLQRHYGPELRRQQWEKLAQAEVRRELGERGLRPVAAPLLESLAGGRRVSARFEVFPALPPLELAALRVRKPVVTIGASDIEYMVQRLDSLPAALPADRREELVQVMQAEAAEAAQEEVEHELEAALWAAHPDLPLPAGLLAAHQEELARRGASDVEALTAAARRQLAVQLLLAAAANQLGVRLGPDELWRETERRASLAADPQAELDRLWGSGGEIQEIEEHLLRRRVMAALLAEVEVEEVPTSFEALARRRRARV